MGDFIVNSNQIEVIDCNLLESQATVLVLFKEGDQTVRSKLSGQPAVDLVMALCPSMVEGKRFQFVRHAWSMHNMIAHPALQIFAWLKLTKFGLMIHDRTVPRPRVGK